MNYRLWRADNEFALRMDRRHRHAAMITTRGKGPGDASATAGGSSFKEGMQIHDDRLLDIVPEPWWNGPTDVMLTLLPSVIIQQQVNSVSTRCIQPNDHGSFDFIWTHFGFEDDDGEVVEFSQNGFEQKPFHRTLAELGGTSVENVDHMVSETLIRGMYAYWREVMEA